MATLKSGVTAPKRSTVMILFAEVRGLMRMAEALEPSVVLALASEFFALVAATVERHAGSVVNVFNDTSMATFAGDGAAQHAVQAAQEIRRDFTILRAAWQRDHDIRAAVAMGLHGGDAVIGAGGSTPDQVLVVGDSVNIAAHLTHRARAGEFVVSKTVMDALAASRFAFDAKELPRFKIPPREPMRIFGVVLETRLDLS